MSSPAPFAPIAELIERSVSIRHVYGDAVHHGDTTVIPVASVVYGFGAGGGRGPAVTRSAPAGPPDPGARGDAEGAGGGGGVRLTPAGVLEIGRDRNRRKPLVARRFRSPLVIVRVHEVADDQGLDPFLCRPAHGRLDFVGRDKEQP